MHKILIIGSAGYIGSNLYHFLVNRGYVVDGIDTEWFGTTPFTEYKDFSILTQYDLKPYSHIILLAGHSSVPMASKGNFSWGFNNNVNNLIGLLDKLAPEQVLINASSSSVYGNLRQGKPYTEDCISCKPLNLYDLSKSVGDYILSLYSHLHWYSLRFGTLAGHYQGGKVRGDTMINLMTRNAKEKGVIEISNAGIKRPIAGLHDTCRAIERIIQVSKEEDNSGCYNIASFNSSVYNIAKGVQQVIDCQIVDNGPMGEPYDFEISTEKFQNQFDFLFDEKVEKITESLLKDYNSIEWSDRNLPKEYQ